VVVGGGWLAGDGGDRGTTTVAAAHVPLG